jgi:ABC-type phosphate/phosphonate transport system substrate-binding protein
MILRSAWTAEIAYVDPSSTSGFILPKALLDQKGIKPSESVFAMRHDNVVTMVYQKQVDAGQHTMLLLILKQVKYLMQE